MRRRQYSNNREQSSTILWKMYQDIEAPIKP
jgi:hypothetical protein